MNAAPTIEIVFALEAPPRVFVHASHNGDAARLLDWLEQHPAFLALIDRANELAAEPRPT